MISVAETETETETATETATTTEIKTTTLTINHDVLAALEDEILQIKKRMQMQISL